MPETKLYAAETTLAIVADIDVCLNAEVDYITEAGISRGQPPNVTKIVSCNDVITSAKDSDALSLPAPQQLNG